MLEGKVYDEKGAYLVDAETSDADAQAFQAELYDPEDRVDKDKFKNRWPKKARLAKMRRRRTGQSGSLRGKGSQFHTAYMSPMRYDPNDYDAHISVTVNKTIWVAKSSSSNKKV